ncbi:hypothetical protein ACFQ9U_09480 [Streptomyces sp. NPDC056568]|uniref:hypothetical protein n=1 Tax=Streptomyces sp. NPDC056568 TaxID=3345866 RepID=UPI0036B3A902
MSTPVHRTPKRPSTVALARQRQQQGRSRGGGTSATSAELALLELQAGVGNRAATVAVQRAKGAAAGGKASEGGEAAARAKRNYRDVIAGYLDRFKKNLEPIDTFIKGVQVPTNAGFTQQAAATVNDGLKHSTAASGTSAASGNFLTEAAGTVVSGMDAVKSRREAKGHEPGADQHRTDRRSRVKGADAVVGAASSGSYVVAGAKEATKLHKAAGAALASEASGVASGVVGLVKGARAAVRVGRTSGKYKDLKNLGDPNLVHAASLARLDEERQAANWAAARAYVALDAYWDQGREDGLDGVSEALDVASEAMDGARDAAQKLQHAEEDVETLNTVHGYATKKQRYKMGKDAVTAVAEPTKAAAGIVTAVAATAGGAGLASNPVGWGLAAAGAGLLLGVTAYKAGRAGTKRYEEVRHPDRWAPQGEDPAEAASRTDSLKHALKFWKKVSKGERQAMARKIYALAAGPAVPGSHTTTAEMRESARALLVALKAGPAHHKLEPEAWAESLDDPARTASWIAEIAEQLASG